MNATLFDHHIHSDRSDGTVSLADRARSVAIRPHGISDHFPWRDRLRTDDDVLRYVDEAARLGLRVGLEYDLGVAPPLRATTRQALDYLIGAIHQIQVDGVWIRYDEAGAYLKKQRSSFSERARFGDPVLARRLRDSILGVVRAGIERDAIDILGHATLSPLAAAGEPEAVYPADWQEELVGVCVAGGVAIEVNESYAVPHREFLERALRLGARFSVGSDTHRELGPLGRTEAMISAAGLPPDRFMSGARATSENRWT